MELLSPAGDLEKLAAAYRYGADAAYIGISGFSLRQRANDVQTSDSHTADDLADQLAIIKGNKRLYGALNIYFNDSDLDELRVQLDLIATLPLDALIVSDIGAVPIIRKRLPGIELHLSTQANCLNTEAARMYMDMGFSRIIPAREMSLTDLARMKSQLPDLGIEVFVHGAMCLAYSGRCLLSAWQAGRSANKGDCAHSCRWNYRQGIEEAQRPGEFLPVEEGDGFTTLLSAKDICMIDHLAELRDAGIDAVKIEGRVKSAYYTAMVTRAYRKEIDRLRAGAPRSESEPYIQELFNVSHREFSTGFYFGDPNEVAPTDQTYSQRYRFMATLGAEVSPGRYALDVKNSFSVSQEIEFVGPDMAMLPDSSFKLLDETGQPTDRITHHETGYLEPSVPVQSGYMIRRAIPAP